MLINCKQLIFYTEHREDCHCKEYTGSMYSSLAHQALGKNYTNKITRKTTTGYTYE